jgi:hypothetical protein
VKIATRRSGSALERDDGSRAALGSARRDPPVGLVFVRRQSRSRLGCRVPRTYAEARRAQAALARRSSEQFCRFTRAILRSPALLPLPRGTGRERRELFRRVEAWSAA